METSRNFLWLKRKNAKVLFQEAQREILFNYSRDAIIILEGEQVIDCNSSALTIFSCTKEQILHSRSYQFSPPFQSDGRDSRQTFEEYFLSALNDEPQFFEWTYQKYNGLIFEAEVQLIRFDHQEKPYLLTIIRDISQRKQIERERATVKDQMNTFHALSQQAHTMSEKEIMQKAVDIAVSITGSENGYLHVVSSDRKIIQLIACSENIHDACQPFFEHHFSVEQAGSWGDCIKTGLPVILNDYQSLPDKKGFPDNQSQFNRLAIVPIIHTNQIEFILGVGNKVTNYDSIDVLLMKLVGEQLSILMNQNRSKESLRIKDKAIASALSALALCNLDGRLTYVNPAFLTMWGYEDPKDVLDRSILSFWSSEREAQKVLTMPLRTGSWEGELTGKKIDGTPFEVQISANLFTSESGIPICILGSFIDITENRQSEARLRDVNMLLIEYLEAIDLLQKELREQAVRDYLTGLFNRRYLEVTLERELSRSERESRQLSIIFIDVDNFKAINDTFGHHAGDIVLKELGGLLASSSRSSDAACRQGGDEFVVVLPGASNVDALKRAEGWRDAFAAKKFTFQGTEYSTTLSIGVATYPANANSANGLLQAADEALYRSKQQHNVVVSSLRSSTLARKSGEQEQQKAN